MRVYVKRSQRENGTVCTFDGYFTTVIWAGRMPIKFLGFLWKNAAGSKN